MATQELVKSLNQQLNREVKTFLRYMLQAASIKGAEHETVRRMYLEEVSDEVGHAQYLANQIAVLGGLMEDTRSSTEDTIPGVNQIPFLGDLFQQRRDQNQKTELVIFLRATVVHDASIEGDFASFRDQLPDKDFLAKPNPSRIAPPMRFGN